MRKLRYNGDDEKFKNITRKKLLELLRDIKIPNKNRMRRFQLIEFIHQNI